MKTALRYVFGIGIGLLLGLQFGMDSGWTLPMALVAGGTIGLAAAIFLGGVSSRESVVGEDVNR